MNYDKENYVEAGKQFELFLISMKKGSEILKSTHRDLTPGMMDFIEDIFQQEKYGTGIQSMVNLAAKLRPRDSHGGRFPWDSNFFVLTSV